MILDWIEIMFPILKFFPDHKMTNEILIVIVIKNGGNGMRLFAG